MNEDVLSVALKVYLARAENRVRLPVAWRVFMRGNDVQKLVATKS
jgi:hypothetical protein